MCKDGQPYVVPVNFGYDGRRLYFHTAQEGQKIDYLTANNRVCFEVEHEVSIIPHPDSACQWGASFYSVIGFGTAHELTDKEEKTRGLGQIMGHYSDQTWQFGERALEQVRVWVVEIEQVTGKRSKDKAVVIDQIHKNRYNAVLDRTCLDIPRGNRHQGSLAL